MSPEERRNFARRCRQDPVWWSQTILGVALWETQKRLIESVRDNVRTACKACHAPGKTFTAAVTALWFLSSFKDSIVVATAPTWRQVEDVLFREVQALHKSSLVDIGGRFTQSPPGLEMDKKWYFRGLSPKEPDSFAGWHQSHVLIIVDEASGVPVKIMEAIRGLMAGGVTIRLLYLGNPIRAEGGFYDAFNKARGMWNPITIDALDTPNLMAVKSDFLAAPTRAEKLAILRGAKVVHPKLVNGAWVADCLEEFGEDSDFFKTRVRAEFPAGGPNQLIQLQWAEDAADRWERMQLGKGGVHIPGWWEKLLQWDKRIEAGYDVARMGDNESVFAANSPDQGQLVFAPLQSISKQKTGGVIDFGARMYHRFRCDQVQVDGVGYGGAIGDGLAEIEGINAWNVLAGSAARSENFLNLRAETFWALRQMFEQGCIAIPRDDRLIAQLSIIRYETRMDRKIKIESKEDMVSRGVRSPDRADAVMLSIARPLKTGDFSVETYGETTDWSSMYG